MYVHAHACTHVHVHTHTHTHTHIHTHTRIHKWGNLMVWGKKSGRSLVLMVNTFETVAVGACMYVWGFWLL